MASEQEPTPKGKGDRWGEGIMAMRGTRAEFFWEAAHSLIEVMYCLPRSEPTETSDMYVLAPKWR